MAPSAVRLEITETLLMDNLEKSAETLQVLKSLGIQLSLDDFGTGYSSLSYLHRFPFDILKIDRSFVMRMEQDINSKQIVETIIILAQKLGLNVVAEGVEKLEQKELLREVGCTYGQGYLFSKPLPAEAIIALLQRLDNVAHNKTLFDFLARLKGASICLLIVLSEHGQEAIEACLFVEGGKSSCSCGSMYATNSPPSQ
jgi:EAL domain-containing protein (putative c-di-GMP-specific phosphodiesterase class I)